MSKKNVLTDEQVVGRFQAAVKLAIEKQKAMGIDIARYDPENECIYVIKPDGTKEILKHNVKRVRYSEQAEKSKS
jgi:hypothetical protein